MDKLWQVFAARFTNWRAGVTEQEVWQQDLRGITDKQVKIGMDKVLLLGSDWAPSGPKFRSLCLPCGEDYGLITLEASFQQGVGNDTNKAPETLYTLRSMTSDEVYRLRHEDSKKARLIWSQVYQNTIEHVINGGDLPEVELQIEKKVAYAPKHRTKMLFKSLIGQFD